MTTRLALITGAGSGLGKELARLLAEEKIPLLLVSKDPEKLQMLKEELEAKTSVSIYPADLADAKSLQGLLEFIQVKTPDLVINSAGLGLYGEILSFPLKPQMDMLKVNIDALVQISIESARSLQAKGFSGTIMNISSAASFFTYPSFALYAASKRFVKEFSLSFDQELTPHGIRVLTCLLGRFDSNFRYNATSHKSKSSPSWDTMSLHTAAKHVLSQIKEGVGCKTVDLRYQIFCNLARLLPRRWIARLLKRGIDKINKA